RDDLVTGVQTCALPILESIAPVGGITVSQSVRDHIGKRLDLTFEDMGERHLKNIEHSIRVYSISLDRPSTRETDNVTSTPREEKIGRASCRERVQIEEV